MNKLIRLIAEHGMSEACRTLTIAVAAIVALLFSLWYGAKFKVSKKKTILFLLIAYPLDYMLLEVSMDVTLYAMQHHLFGIDTIVNSQSKTFVIIPMVALLCAKILGISWKITADLLAVANLLNYAICSLGCLFTGCCIGYSCSWGIYSPTTEQNVFPIQIVNTCIMLVVVIYLVCRSKRRGYTPDGKQFPIMLLLFGSTRFITEFGMDNEKLIFGCSVVAFYAVIMCMMGVIWIVVQDRIKQWV